MSDVEQKSGFTAGPWRAEPPREFAGVKWDNIIRGGKNNDPICTVFVAGYMAREAAANARLIAAAPDMLRALQEVIGELDDWDQSSCAPVVPDPVSGATCSIIRQAIAKATGASHA